MEIIKIDNPLWVQNLAPDVEKMLGKLKLPNINTYTLITYLQQIAMSQTHELHVAASEEQGVVGFASWYVRGIPFVGTAFLEFIYSKQKGAGEQLLLEFEEFAKRNKAPYLMADIITIGKVQKHFTDIAEKLGYSYVEMPYQSFVFRK